MRIRGHIGAWPVDLTVELDEAEWARLAVCPPPAACARAEPPVAPERQQNDGLWLLAQDLLRQSGAVDGPALLGQLAALAGSAQAGKRLLVRLRHSPQVRVEAGAQAPVYRWIAASEANLD